MIQIDYLLVVVVVDREYVQSNYMNEFQMVKFQIIMNDHLEQMLRQVYDLKILPQELKLRILYI